jgi:hypothetical protein
MPDAKKSRRTFAAQTPSVLERIQLLEQQARGAEPADPSTPAETTRTSSLNAGTPEPALVKKLIKFIKTI